MARRSQFALLGTRRFMPFFIAQGLGAFNDSLYKQALILAILFKLGPVGNPNLWVNLCALLFVLPFFLFSALGGQLGEKLHKHQLIRRLSLAELLLLPLGAAGFLWQSLPLMLLVLFLLGTQAALFGPVKYSVLPEHLDPEELVGGNALVEMATFLAILGGTIAAGVLLSSEAYRGLVAGVVLLVALLAWLASLAIPHTEPAYPKLQLDWHLFRQIARTLHLGLWQQEKSVSHALIGNAWFWFLGTVYLTQIPAYAKNYLRGDATVVSLILTLFSVGVALGSVLCGRLSKHRLEPGLVPLGAVGLSFFGVLLWVGSGHLGAAAGTYDWRTLLGHPSVCWSMLGILGLGASGGLYIVPLYALIQARTPEQQRARVIAANNILNTLFMVLASLLSMLLLVWLGLSIPALFLVVSLAGLLLNAYLFWAVPEFLQRLTGLGRRSRSG